MTKGLGSQPSRLALQCDMLQALLLQGKNIPACSACRLWARCTFLCGDQCGEFSISLPKASCQNAMLCTSFHRARDLSRGKCPATHLEKEQSHTGPDTDPCRPRSRIGLHWRALTRLPTWTHANVRKPKSHNHRALTHTHADQRGDRFLHRRGHWRGPTRTHAGTPPPTDADTHADPRGDLSPHWRGPTRTHAGPPQRRPQNAYGATRQVILLQGCPAPRGSASVSASVQGRVPAWDRVGPRGSASVSASVPASVLALGPGPCGFAWVRGSASVSASVRGPGPRVGPRGSARQCQRATPRGSASVRVSARVGAGPIYRGPACVRVDPRQCPLSVRVSARRRPRWSWVRVSVRVSAGRHIPNHF